MVDENLVLKLIDFGAAKELHKGHTSVAYIVSRFYRAPELLLGAEDYTTKIDIWAAGCVLFEMFAGVVLFQGKDARDQIKRILAILGCSNLHFQNVICVFTPATGSPSKQDFLAMNSSWDTSISLVWFFLCYL